MADKTRFPGFDGYESSQAEQSHYSNRKNQGLDLEAPMGRERVGSATVVPSMEDYQDSERASSSTASAKGKPLVGFLYSVSKTIYAEYWPLYLGPNLIGRGREADVNLQEATVSSEHAMITVHLDKENGELYAVLEDVHSTNGVRLNGTNIKFNRVECHNMDVIKIGDAYELLLVLVDCSAYGLKPAEGFIEVRKQTSFKSNRIVNGPTPSPAPSPAPGPNTRLNNVPRSDKTRSLDYEEEVGGGTRTR